MALTIKARLFGLLAVLLAMLAGVGTLAILELKGMEASMQTIYEDRLVPTRQLGRIDQLMRDNIIQLGLAGTSASAVNAQTGEAHRSAIQSAMASHLEQVNDNIDTITALWGDYLATALTAKEAELAEQFARDRKIFVENGLRQAINLLETGRLAEAQRHREAMVIPLYEQANGIAVKLLDLQDRVAQEEFATAQAETRVHQNLILAALLLSLVGALGSGYWLIRSIDRPLKRMIGYFKAMAAGDMSHRIVIDRQDEIGEALSSLAVTQDKIRDLVTTIQRSTDNITTGASEIAAGNADLAQRTEQQASALQETATSMEQVASTVKHNTDNTAQANTLIQKAAESATDGGDKARQAMGKMAELNESSDQISGIISVIDGIAFQTNILALNASVEAARAGEHGRGFAVVAQEVRTLAKRCADAAKEIQQRVNLNADIVKDGSEFVEQAGHAMQGIVDDVSKVSALMAEVTRGSHEQTSAVDQVSVAVSQMDQATQQNAALVEQTANASVSLEHQAQELSRAAAFFQVGDHMPASPVTAILTHIQKTAPATAENRTAPIPAAPHATGGVQAGPVTPSGRQPALTEPEWEAF